MARLALKLAYDGTRFSGSQLQPSVRTVHSELQQALRTLGLHETRILWAGRTDAGVSAAGNVAVIDVDGPDERLLPALTFQMDDAWVWAQASVPDVFEPRHAKRRRYRYFLQSDLEAKAVDDALSLFVGMHDFTSFARIEPDVNPVRTVEEASARRRGALLVIDVSGPNFLWNQVRRIVNAAESVAAGRVSAEDIEAALAGKIADYGLAPAEPLVLLDVEYDGLDWREADARMRRRVFERLARRRDALRLEEARLTTLLGDEETLP